jgi:hypothetical protein
VIKTLFLMPEADNDGHSYLQSDWEALETRLFALGGFSLTVGVVGAWESQGRVYRDVSRQYSVSLASWRHLPVWLDLVQWARGHFRQLAIYIEVAGITEIIEG